MATAKQPKRGFLVGEGAITDTGFAAGVAPLPRIDPRKRSQPSRGDGLSVAFSRRDETAKGLLPQRFLFQVPPTDSFSFSSAFGHSDYDTVDAGQFSRPSGRQLKTLTFATMFVDYDPFWAAWHYGTASPYGNGLILPPVDPLGWTEDLIDLTDSGTPFDLTVGMPQTNGRYDIRSMAVTLRNIDVEERAGEPDARYLNVQLTEWRPISLARRRRGLPVTLTLHEEGDRATFDRGAGEETIRNPSLSRLAKKFYGSPSRYRYIARHRKNPHLADYAGKDLAAYVRRYGRGKKGKRTIKVVVPDLPGSDDVGAVLGPTGKQG